MIDETRRLADTWLSKLHKSSLITILFILIGVVFFFVGREYKTVTEEQAAHAVAISSLEDKSTTHDQKIVAIEKAMPILVEEMKTMNARLWQLMCEGRKK